MTNSSRVVVVDLDGTLLRTDLFLEALLRFLRRNPLNVLRLLGWISQGRQVAKSAIAREVHIDPSTLPFEEPVLEYLREEKAAGTRLVLATGAPRPFAERVAEHLALFDDVLATDSARNVKGQTKLDLIRDLLQSRPFVYAGDAAADQVIWRAAEAGVYVNAEGYADQAAAEGREARRFVTRGPVFSSLVRQLRAHQWIKNLLVFLPLVVSHSYGTGSAVFASVIAFICFCLCASGVYCFNDLLDLHEDRQHPRKRRRPLAAGELTLVQGILACVCLVAAAFGIALTLLPALFMVLLLLYFVSSTAYSVYLKKIWAIDAITLAGLYTLRILAGAAAIAVVPSFWLLAFSVFLFLGLAYLKRYVEFSQVASASSGRGYEASDSESMFSLGAANMTVSVLVMALYVHEVAASAYYQTPELLWLLCVLLIYWSNRVWFKARRGLVDDDPVVWALRDPVSRALAVVALGIVLGARFFSLLT